MLNTCRSGAVGRASAVVTCLLLLSSCANDTAPSDEASYRVEFSDPAVPIEVALKEAPAAVSGTLTEFLIDPIMSDPAAAGRRIAVLEIDEVLRGDLAAGESIWLWYGTELRDNAVPIGSPNTVELPDLGAEVIVLGEYSDVPDVGPVIVPLSVTGVLEVRGDVALVPSGDGADPAELSVSAIRATLEIPAPVVEPNLTGEYDRPSVDLPSEPPPQEPSDPQDAYQLAYQAMLEDLGLSEDEFMSLPPDEQQRLADQYLPSEG